VYVKGTFISMNSPLRIWEGYYTYSSSGSGIIMPTYRCKNPPHYWGVGIRTFPFTSLYIRSNQQRFHDLHKNELTVVHCNTWWTFLQMWDWMNSASGVAYLEFMVIGLLPISNINPVVSPRSTKPMNETWHHWLLCNTIFPQTKRPDWYGTGSSRNTT